ncbi:MAG: MGMT family protein [Candidatus Andersenbacteria bacterium]|nr:MGMT family protein [Candidatus Andersenbacteria bacterium]
MSGTPFAQQVMGVVAKIPAGHVMTYQEVAQAAGSPRAYRAVGNILKRNHNAAIPCHRVIRSDGALGEYNRGAGRKARLLQEEGYGIERYGD